MPFPLDSTDLVTYKNLPGKKIVQHPTVGACFICEGRYLVEEAIRAAHTGQLRFISLLCDSRQSKEWENKIPPSAQFLTLEPDELHALVGFSFHRGVLCCCAVPEAPKEEQILESSRLLVLPQIDNVDNLGQLIRTAAALGMDAILLAKGPSPFARRCVRVSMGACWKIPILITDEPGRILNLWLRSYPNTKSEIVGTAATSDAESALQWIPAPRTALVLGSESHGLEDFWLFRCKRHVRIPLARQIDCLNISAAGAILMSKMSPCN